MIRPEAAVAPVASPADASREALLRAEEELRSLSGEILERYEEVSLVYRLCDALGDALGEDNIARLVVDNAAEVLGARAGEFWLTRGEHPMLAAAMPAGAAVRWEAARRYADAVLGSGRPLLFDDEESVVAVPLPARGPLPLGAIVLRGRKNGRPYRSGETKLLMALASLSAAFIRADRLAQAARREESRRREDEIARQIHLGLLPTKAVAFPGLEIHGACLAAESIGGDYYGYLPGAEDRFGVAVADISGHGVGAAIYMAAAKGALHAEARRGLAPGELLHRTNAALVADFASSDVFATAFVARFDADGRGFEFSNGGHNAPLLVRADGTVEHLERQGPALGIIDDVDYPAERRSFTEGDLLLIYTDGVTEARSSERVFYGTDRLVETTLRLGGRSARGLIGSLLEDLERHVGGRPHDDVTVVAVRSVAAAEADG